MSLFEEQISCDDSALRLDAMRKLSLVGQALGAEETLSSLLPFLAGHTDDDDEMLLKMAQEVRSEKRISYHIYLLACLYVCRRVQGRGVEERRGEGKARSEREKRGSGVE